MPDRPSGSAGLGGGFEMSVALSGGSPGGEPARRVDRANEVAPVRTTALVSDVPPAPTETPQRDVALQTEIEPTQTATAREIDTIRGEPATAAKVVPTERVAEPRAPETAEPVAPSDAAETPPVTASVATHPSPAKAPPIAAAGSVADTAPARTAAVSPLTLTARVPSPRRVAPLPRRKPVVKAPRPRIAAVRNQQTEKPAPQAATAVSESPAPADAVADPADRQVNTAAATDSADGAERAKGSGEPGRSISGSHRAARSGGTPGLKSDYLAELRAWLERHKEYPRRAKRRHQEGTVLLRFIVARDGRVLEAEIRRSSGHRSLDGAAKTLIERASPLPEFPRAMKESRLELVYPVAYSLR